MNQLSWMIYLASVLDSTSIVLAIILICLLIAAGIWAVAMIPMSIESAEPETWTAWKKIGKFIFIPLIILCPFLIFIPNKDTIYAIAASQAGEQVVKSPLGQKAEKALESWLDKQIANTAEEKK